MDTSAEAFEEFEIGLDEPILTTMVVCRLLSMPAWVLKRLDEEEIVRPLRQRRKARLYSKRELKQVAHVWYLIEQRGVNISGVKVILEMEKGE